MLKLELKSKETWDPVKTEFGRIEAQTLVLEHSLVSLSKWESKHHKPFLDKTEEKTKEEIIDYIKCMTITQNVKDEVYVSLQNDSDALQKVNEYIQDSMTATTFYEYKGKSGQKPSREIITSELIYYWMVAYNIPFICEKWHLNRLLTLVRICSIKNDTGKKMSKSEILARNKSLNAARKARLNTRG